MNQTTQTTEEKNALSFDESPNDSSNGKSAVDFLKLALFFIMGLAFSSFNALESISPFSTAFLSAVPYHYCFPVFLGSCLGHFIASSWQSALKYIVSLIIVSLFRLIIIKRFRESDGSLICCVVSFCSMLCAGLVHLFFIELTLWPFIQLVTESLMTLCCGYFFTVSFKSPVLKGGISALNTKDKFCLSVSLCSFLMCISAITVEGISPGRILCCLILMFISLYKGIEISSIAGIVLGASLCLTPDGAYLFPAFALAGLVSGVLSNAGQITVALSFTFTYLISSLFIGDISEMWLSLIEPCIACGAFLVIPSGKINALQELIEKSGIIKETHVNRAVSDNLQQASENIYEVAKIVTAVSDKLDNIINPEVNRLFSSLQQKVCDQCPKKALCWNKNFDSTASDILTIAGIESRKSGKIGLAITCKRYDYLCSAITSCYPAYGAAMASKMKVSEMRRLLTDQFIGLGDFLSDLSACVSDSRIKDNSKSTYLKTALRDSGISVNSVSCFAHSERVVIEIFLSELPTDSTLKKIKPILEFITKRRFQKPEIQVGEFQTVLTFKENPLYKVRSGYSQRPVKSGSLCGDAVAIFSSHHNFPTALISDGMGTGSRAAIDSTMTAGIMEKLLSCGFSFSGSLKLVNSALIMKSTDESISTVDTVQINPFTGTADFYKAGAAISFIRHNGEVIVIERSSLPVGIIRNITFAHERRQLKKGDIVLLVSDGVTGSDCGWINDELLAWSTSSMEDLAGHIANLARLRSEKTTKDDITVVAVKLEANS